MLIEQSPFDSRTKLINTFWFLILIFLCFLFGKERIVFFDGAERLYEIVAHNRNYFPHYRFTAGLNHLIPWVIRQFDVPFHWIANGFIVNYCIWPVLVFVYLRLVVKDERQVLIYLISLSLMFTMVFFFPNHESLIAFYTAVLFFSVFDRKPGAGRKAELRYYALLAFSIFVVVFAHLAQVMAVGLLMVYMLFIRKEVTKTMIAGSMLIVILFLKAKVFTSSYEESVVLGFGELIRQLQELPTDLTFTGYLRSFTNVNGMLTLVMLLTSISLIKKRSFGLILLLFGAVLGTAAYVSILFPYPYAYGTEGYTKASGLLVAVIFIDHYWKDCKEKMRNALLMVIYGFTLMLILLNGLNYKQYYKNIKHVAGGLEMNTVYVSDSIYMDAQFLILPQMSAIINLYETGNCHYFTYVSDSLGWKNELFPDDEIEYHFCFNQPYEVVPAPEDVKRRMNSQYDLLFEFYNSSKSRKFGR